MSESIVSLLRRSDWPERLAQAIETRRAQPFAWGTNDCCHFAADVIEALTDIDLAGALRGSYSTQTGAFAVLAAEGGLPAFITSKLGPPRDIPALAQRGDVVYAEHDSQPLLGVVCGAGQWCAPGVTGLQFSDLTGAELVWRVG